MVEEGGDAKADASEEAGVNDEFSGVRRMVEDMTVTPFFLRHSSHMPASIKIHAEVIEKKDLVILKTELAGFHEDQVEISANENSIHIKLHSGEAGKDEGDEKTHEGEILLNSSYVTPVPVDPDGLPGTRPQR